MFRTSAGWGGKAALYPTLQTAAFARYHPRKSMTTWLTCREQTGVPGVPSKAAVSRCVPVGRWWWWFRGYKVGSDLWRRLVVDEWLIFYGKLVGKYMYPVPWMLWVILYRTPCKLTAKKHLKMDGWKMNDFVFGMAQPSRCFCC